MTNEWQVRRICSAISSTTVTNAFLRTSKVTGSRVRSAIVAVLLGDTHTDGAGGLDGRFHARRDERRGIELVDDGRACEGHARWQRVAVEDGRVARLVGAVEAHRPGRGRLGQLGVLV